METPLLVSSCLIGVPCRYDATSNAVAELIKYVLSTPVSFISMCPEAEGGLFTPRPPAEIQTNGRILTLDGRDITTDIQKGCRKVLQIVDKYTVRYAVLKAYSPSCGYGVIYNGSFSGRLIPGKGLCAAALEKKGVKIYDEKSWQTLLGTRC